MSWAGTLGAGLLRHGDGRAGFRVRCTPLQDDSRLSCAATAYAGDLILMAPALPRHGVGVERERKQLLVDWRKRSLHHAMWFHDPERADGR